MDLFPEDGGWLGPAHGQLQGQLAPEAVAMETQTDVLLNSYFICGFSAECHSGAGQDRGWEGWGLRAASGREERAPARPLGLALASLQETTQRH